MAGSTSRLPFIINQQTLGPAIIAEFDAEQQQEIKIDESVSPITIDPYVKVPFARYSDLHEYVKKPLLPEQITYFTEHCLIDWNPEPNLHVHYDRLASIVERLTPKVRPEVEWIKAQPTLEISVNNEDFSTIEYKINNNSLLSLRIGTHKLRKDGLTKYITSDSTGNHQTPTRDIISNKIKTARNLAGVINEHDLDYTSLNSKRQSAFNCQEINAAENLARRLGISICEEVSEIKKHNYQCWENAFIKRLPQTVDELYDVLSRFINVSYSSVNNLPRMDIMEPAVDYLLNLALDPKKLNEELRREIGQLGVIRVMAKETELRRKISSARITTKKLTEELERAKEGEINTRQEYFLGVKAAHLKLSETLRQLSLGKKEIRELKKRTKPSQTELSELDDCPF